LLFFISITVSLYWTSIIELNSSFSITSEIWLHSSLLEKYTRNKPNRRMKYFLRKNIRLIEISNIYNLQKFYQINKIKKICEKKRNYSACRINSSINHKCHSRERGNPPKCRYITLINSSVFWMIIFYKSIVLRITSIHNGGFPRSREWQKFLISYEIYFTLNSYNSNVTIQSIISHIHLLKKLLIVSICSLPRTTRRPDIE
jgi:hypothetical protein